MRTSTIIWIIAIVVVIAGGIFWFMRSSNASTTPTTTSTTTTAPSATPTISVGSSSALGSYLEATNGMTLYTYQNDTAGTSTCTGDCAITWPPYTVTSASDIVPSPDTSGTLATITRTDGTIQVTYNGMPLYLYSLDVNPGDTNGNGVDSLWSVAHP